MQSRMGLAVIVKDEISLLEKFVTRNDITNFFKEIKFLDGFSIDGTYEKLKEYDKQGWCRIYQRDLNFNFSEQRNHLNSLMESEYIMRLDIDEYMNENLMDFIRNFGKDKNRDLYIIDRKELVDGEFLRFVPTPVIYKNNGIIRWENRIHEIVINHKNKENVGEDCFIIHDKNTGRCAKQNKFYWDNWKEQRGIIRNGLE